MSSNSGIGPSRKETVILQLVTLIRQICLVDILDLYLLLIDDRIHEVTS